MYTATVSKYISQLRLPIWVEHVPVGTHPERYFHDHEFSEIVLILKGQALHLVDNMSCAIKAADVLVIHSGYRHSFDKTDDLELINIIYDHKQLSIPLLDACMLPLFNFLFPHKPIENSNIAKPIISLKKKEMEDIYLLIKHLDEELKSIHTGNLFYSLTLFMEIIILMARHGSSAAYTYQPQILLGDATKFMNDNFQRNISIKELCKVAKMSERNFFRNFKNFVGCSPLDYLRKIRIQRASEILLSTDKSISEIAHECGFSDSNYFCRTFKKEMFTSPRQFRLNKLPKLKFYHDFG
ncbi:MAG: helix-turn-helix domain-containing protein [Victivallaceae bacterium]|nr:helix-turn-helix domain-containing protein [Victivallaceae bacterium]